MTDETALPTGESAEASESTAAVVAENLDPSTEQTEGTEAKETPSAGEAPKKEKTPEQREIDRLRRRVDNLTRQKYELRAAVPQTQPQPQTPANDDEPVSLSRAELKQLIEEQAKQLAPTISEQQAEIERRQGLVQSLAKSWGQEEFDAKASELDDAFGGLTDRSGKPKPATDAIFEADDPKAVIEYLTDPENIDDAERIAGLSAIRAGREIARIEAKLEAAKANAKPKPSAAAKPLEAVRGGGVPNGMPNPADTKAYIKWANEQEFGKR